MGFLVVLVPSHRASSLLEVSACTPEAPAIRKTAHPIRKATTTAMRRAWPTTAPLPSLHLAGAHKPHHEQERRRHRQPRQPYHPARRQAPGGVREGLAARWLLVGS